eukprot:11406293-Alexandrium_andersonii.AAC.1
MFSCCAQRPWSQFPLVSLARGNTGAEFCRTLATEPQGACKWAESGRVGAVSYTHLTLPTICSV